MASAVEKVLRGTLQKTESQKAFSPWWSDFEDKLLYSVMILGGVDVKLNGSCKVPLNPKCTERERVQQPLSLSLCVKVHCSSCSHFVSVLPDGQFSNVPNYISSTPDPLCNKRLQMCSSALDCHSNLDRGLTFLLPTFLPIYTFNCTVLNQSTKCQPRFT
jgi:hypothetical protein